MRRSWPPQRISRASNLAGNAFVPLERSRALTEPIGGRIIEVSNDDPNIFDGEPGNPRIGWTTYVPPGSVAKGREIVTTGGRGKSDRTGHGVDTAYLASLPPVKTSRPLTQPSGNATR